jgi:CrcB protein
MRKDDHHPLRERFRRALGAQDPLPIDPDLDPEDPGEPSRDHHRVLVRRRHPGVLAAIACGGFIGTFGRYEFLRLWPTSQGHFPFALFVVNTSGAFLIGLFLTLILERIGPTRYLRPFAITGVLGGWTTMSSFAIGIDTLVKTDHSLAALEYLISTLCAGILAVTFGMSLGRVRRLPQTIEAPR